MVSTSTAAIYAFSTLGFSMVAVGAYFMVMLLIFALVGIPAASFGRAVIAVLSGGRKF